MQTSIECWLCLGLYINTCSTQSDSLDACHRLRAAGTPGGAPHLGLGLTPGSDPLGTSSHATLAIFECPLTSRQCTLWDVPPDVPRRLAARGMLRADLLRMLAGLGDAGRGTSVRDRRRRPSSVLRPESIGGHISERCCRACSATPSLLATRHLHSTRLPLQPASLWVTA